MSLPSSPLSLRRCVAALLASMVCIQLGAAVAKQSFVYMGVATVASLRLLFAALILGGVHRPWRHRTPLSPRTWGAIGLYGMALGLMNLSFYVAIVRIPLGVAVALEFCGPLGLAVTTSRRRGDLGCAALAAAGIALLLPHAEASGALSLDPLGVAAALLAGVGWVGYIVFGQAAGASVDSGVVTSYGILAGALTVLPWGLWTEGTAVLHVGAYPLALALLVAILCSALPYSLEMLALRRLPAPTFSILMSLEPAIGALSGLVLLGERLRPGQWLGILAIVMASLGSGIVAQRAHAAARQGSSKALVQ